MDCIKIKIKAPINKKKLNEMKTRTFKPDLNRIKMFFIKKY